MSSTCDEIRSRDMRNKIRLVLQYKEKLSHGKLLLWFEEGIYELSYPCIVVGLL